MFPNPQELSDQCNWAVIRAKAGYVHPRPFPVLVVFSLFEKDCCMIFVKNSMTGSQLIQVIP